MLVAKICGCGETGRRARLRGVWETLWVRVPPSAPYKRKKKIFLLSFFNFQLKKNQIYFGSFLLFISTYSIFIAIYVKYLFLLNLNLLVLNENMPKASHKKKPATMLIASDQKSKNNLLLNKKEEIKIRRLTKVKIEATM